MNLVTLLRTMPSTLPLQVSTVIQVQQTRPFATVQKALDTVKAGQTIYVRGGTYNALNTFKTSGSEGKYITLRNYPNETPF